MRWGSIRACCIPQTVLRDVPTSFGPYTPENFDGRFLGPITATDALNRSRNIPAVWVASQLHSPDLYQFLQGAGIGHHGERRALRPGAGAGRRRGQHAGAGAALRHACQSAAC